ncbi:MAG: hypothetical protein EHM36_05105 [Deltaproteobacteria bacterium]|nr:MAG: hypothetical protein EHM36_05105 [Deltaproteobacteria bacterium]
MEHFFIIASLWLALAVPSAIIAYHLRISIAWSKSVWESFWLPSRLLSTKQTPLVSTRNGCASSLHPGLFC